MKKIVNFEELIKIDKHNGCKRDDLNSIPCAFCRKYLYAKDMLYCLGDEDAFLYRGCSEECINLLILQYTMNPEMY